MGDAEYVDVGIEALDLLTIGEVAARLRLSSPTIRRLISSGALEAVHIGRSVRVAPEALAEYKAGLRQAAQAVRAVLGEADAGA
jgi:excisionase family DNA binding protein